MLDVQLRQKRKVKLKSSQHDSVSKNSAIFQLKFELSTVELNSNAAVLALVRDQKMQHTREDVSRIRLSWAFCFYFILFCRFRLSDLTTSFSLIPKPLHQLHLLLPPLGVKLPDSSLSIFSDNTRNFYGGGTNSFSFNSLSLFICFSSSPIPSFIFFKLFPNPFSLETHFLQRLLFLFAQKCKHSGNQ